MNSQLHAVPLDSRPVLSGAALHYIRDTSAIDGLDFDGDEDGAFERLLDAPEAASLLRMHPKTLQAMARAGTVPCIRMGKYWRFRASSLDVWVRNRLQSEHQSRRVR